MLNVNFLIASATCCIAATLLKPELKFAVDEMMHSYNQYQAQDCCTIQLRTGSTVNGVYNIYPFIKQPNTAIRVFCDFKTNGGGWTVFQRREEVNGPTERFFRDWESYEAGFGDLEFSYWLGLPIIAALTSGFDQTLRVELTDWEGDFRYADYTRFQVGDSSKSYVLTVGNYTGTAGDSITEQHNGKQFSTYDADNDNHSSNCANVYHGAWWYGSCHHSNLNGEYFVGGSIEHEFANGVNWYTFRGHYYSSKRSEMKIRNRNFPNGCSPTASKNFSIKTA